MQPGYGPPPQGYAPPPKQGMSTGVKVLLAVLGLGAIATLGTCMVCVAAVSSASKKESSATSPLVAAAGSPAAVRPTVPEPTAAFDAIGAEKDWDQIHVTLKEASARGKAGAVTLLLKNNQSKEEQISSLAQIQMTNEVGDKGEEDEEGREGEAFSPLV